ncbi:MAG: leucine-rich repeat domain-containing protein [Planctomycetaceae bacterium]
MQTGRRWFQFSLRSLLVGMFVLCLGLGVYLPAKMKARRQWEAVRAFKAAGGGLASDKKLRLEITESSEAPFWQKWLGIDCPTYAGLFMYEPDMDGKTFASHLRQLRQLKMVSLGLTEIDDEGLEVLSEFPRLHSLHVSSGDITDAGALCFAGNSRLHELDLWGGKLTNQGLAVVAQLPELKKLKWRSGNATGEGLYYLRNHPQLSALNIDGEMASDVGFEHLGTCSKLESLYIEYANTLTGRGIEALAHVPLRHLGFSESPLAKDAISALSKLTSLETLGLAGRLSPEDLAALGPFASLKKLWLSDCRLTGEGLRSLAPLHQLEKLHVNMSGLGDEDMELLASFTHLKRVSLSHSRVTDAGLMKLAPLKQLVEMEVTGSQVTQAGVNEFRQLAPNVKVFGP